MGAPPGADDSAGVQGLRCCPVAMLTAAPGPKVPSCLTAVLPQASRGCLLCSFEDGSAPHPAHGFFSPSEPQHGTEVDRIPGGMDGAGIKALAALCSLPGTAGAAGEATQHLAHCAVTAAVLASHGHRSCRHPTARGAGAVGEPIPQLSPRSSRVHPQALGHKTETSCKFPPPKPALAPLSLSRWLALGDL